MAKVKIVGCTQQELNDDHGENVYLTVGKEYEAVQNGNFAWSIRDDENEAITVLGPEYGCAHIPKNAHWVEIK